MDADGAFEPVLVLLTVAVVLIAGVYGVSAWLAAGRGTLTAPPFSGGLAPAEHALSRFHVRWYPVTMVFLAFDMEMLFMYAWVRIVTAMGASAVIEMFVFLGILLAGIGYAWREGAFRWT